ncbi:carbohydrate ABC transporter permease [Ktedonobacter racemifer]|uniref:Binding-protein-dependent transport systems inner membrane component n=1 Tax=Ktedonobacter racemifer DSM 44963 TaxID=485913 RepID=D6TUD7_KTERA|nr:sugar ABC transporter permease [Ktedonobacter racemifer]EFH84005.1 binding-protein-dependent transport systems inner membrane component [Ktedonobacter racemifer DSM 44963]
MSDVSIQRDVSVGTPSQQQIESKKAQRRRIDLVGFGFVLPFLLIYVVFLVWPVILGFRMSFFNWTIGGKGVSNFLGLANYQELIGDPAFWSSLWTTIVFTVISTPVLVIIALLLALLVNRAIPAQSLFRTIFFAPFILPVSVVTLIWSWLYQPGFGLINGTLTSLGLKEVPWLTDTHVAMIAVVILTTWWTVGFNFVLYLAGMQQIPHELLEAANIDGAGSWSRIRWITIPLLRRSTVLIVILQVIASLQLFTQTYLLTGGGPNFSTRSIIQYIYENGFTSFRMGLASAMSYVFFILVLLVSLGQFALLNRQRRDA